MTKDFSQVERYFSNNNRRGENIIEDELSGKYIDNRRATTSTKSLGVHRTLELFSLSRPQN